MRKQNPYPGPAQGETFWFASTCWSSVRQYCVQQ